MADDRIRLFCFFGSPRSRYRRRAFRRRYSWSIPDARRFQALSVGLRAELPPGRAEMFLAQSYDASTESKKRPTEPLVRVLRRSAHHQRMDATNERAARYLSSER